MDKTQFIGDLQNGQEVAGLFLIGAASQGQARNGPFWKLDLRDSSGGLEAKIWSPQSQAYPKLAPGDLAEVTGRVTMFRERLEIAVDRLRLLEAEERAVLDLSLFMAASERPGPEMLAELRELCRKNFTHGPWKKLALSFLQDEDVAERLVLAPAAKGMHHAYAGGLLEHTLSVCRLCLRFADHYPHLDRQALLAGGLFHDMGKLWELTQGLSVDYTGEGRLLGHIQLMLDKLAPLLRKSGLEEPLALHLRHLILSHHGQLEFGSPRLPATAEAIALHYADNIDAKLNQVHNALSNLAEGEEGWSSYNPGLERHLYRSPATPEAPERARKTATREQDAAAGEDAGKKAPVQAAPQAVQWSLLSGT